jgi:hypothetical protein
MAMTRRTRFEIELEARSVTLAKMNGSPLAKMSAPEIEAQLRKYFEGLTDRMLGEYRSQLRKGIATPADMGEVMRKAAEEYRASAPSPLNAIEAELDALSEHTDRMVKALPAFKRQMLYGTPDPDGTDVPHPLYDPQAPIIDYGGARIAEKGVTLDAHGRRGPQTYTPFVMALSKHDKLRDLAAGAVDAALQHRNAIRED